MSPWKIVRRTLPCLAALCFALALPGSSAPAAAETYPSSDVLVPYFEVGLGPAPGLNTLFSICNDSDEQVDVLISVHTNWGIPVLQIPHRLKGDEVHTVNLHTWIVEGKLFDRVLTEEELSHVQAALSGKPSPQDNKWYGTEIVPGRAVGYVTIRTTGAKRPDVLWGDYFLVDPAAECFQGETLANIDRGQCDVPCERHGIRFLNGGAFEDGTELVIWTEKRWAPSPTPEPLYEEGVKVRGLAYDEPGRMLGRRDLSLLPVEVVKVSELTLPEPFGWLDLSTDEPSFITGRFTATFNHTSSALHSYCLPKAQGGGDVGPAIRIRKRVNGEDADQPPGLSIPIGSPVQWEYEVDNIGTEPLTAVMVEDDTGVVVTCPQDTLEPGESMVCTASGTAEPCDHVNRGTVVASASDNSPITDSDLAHYTGTFQAAIGIEKAVNGQDADEAPGPTFEVGTALQWTFAVTNSGNVALTGVTVTDDSGLAVTCPKTKLEPAETMTCTASSTAVAGDHTNVAVAKGKPPCGPDVTAGDPVHIHVPALAPGIDVEKLTNGEDADVEPGPALEMGAPVQWTYRVTNTGNVALTGVAVTDDRGVAVTCPKTTLEPGESMVCTGSGVAQACQYGNLGTATATEAIAPGRQVSDQDPSHYFGQIHPAITLVKLTEGTDGPDLVVGDPVHWTYTVTNAGDITLTGVGVQDDQGLDVTCPKPSLAPGESMTCTAQGMVVPGPYRNLALATGTPPCGENVTAMDGSTYTGRTLGISLEKLVNGQDADVPPYPVIVTGAPVLWAYVVTNTGDFTLATVTVTDSTSLVVACPKTALTPGESMICTANGTAVAGQHTNLGTATGTALGHTVTATDPATYIGEALPGIFLEKRVNGNDADTPPGPTVLVGSTLQWTFVVTNIGGAGLTNVTVTDDSGLVVTCPKTALAPAETMTCTAGSTAADGQHQNLATAVGTPPSGPTVSATDPAHYLGLTPGISLEKLVNGQDADNSPGVLVVRCTTLQWSFVVTNTGEIPLVNVSVVDDQAGTLARTGTTCPNPVPFLLACPKTTLAVGETMTCTATSTATVLGTHDNLATAQGTPEGGGGTVSDQDPAWYTVVSSFQGCTPGYWKNHTGSWPPTGYATGQPVMDVFPASIRFPSLAQSTLLQALSFAGGSGNEGAAEILLRAAVAALLNASHPDVAYPRMPASVLADVNLALVGSRDQMLSLAAGLDADNNRGCPLH